MAPALPELTALHPALRNRALAPASSGQTAHSHLFYKGDDLKALSPRMNSVTYNMNTFLNSYKRAGQLRKNLVNIFHSLYYYYY